MTQHGTGGSGQGALCDLLLPLLRPLARVLPIPLCPCLRYTASLLSILHARSCRDLLTSRPLPILPSRPPVGRSAQDQWSLAPKRFLAEYNGLEVERGGLDTRARSRAAVLTTGAAGALLKSAGSVDFAWLPTLGAMIKSPHRLLKTLADLFPPTHRITFSSILLLSPVSSHQHGTATELIDFAVPPGFKFPVWWTGKPSTPFLLTRP
ncbi:hypothetical protein N7510_005845 [Penicillium lagena]|uniref:uncharacterized protein n=1 Tax=Penicillium lagena TaxID=94218 RepID=UPI00253FE2BA|nr:uncharacterized protein N7510_005845 [Penicillium lagena]KAJ5612651.1 hypothetical protein N7510_005845 [Penicillium lagena]